MEPLHTSSRHNNIPYLVTLICFVVVCLATITAVMIYRPDQDNMPLATQIFGFMATVTVALMAFIKSNEGVAVVHETKNIALETQIVQAETKALQAETRTEQDRLGHAVDGRMSEMMKIVRELARKQGLEEGLETGRQNEVIRVADIEQSRVAGVAEGTETGTAAGIVTGTREGTAAGIITGTEQEQAAQKGRDDAHALMDGEKK